MITLYETRDMSTGQLTGTPRPLVDVIDCTVTEERNGMFALTMRYPIGADYSSMLVPDAIIMATPRPNADPEPFRIYEIEQVIEGITTVRANHIVYDLDGTGVQKSVVDGRKFAALVSRLNSYLSTAGPSGIVGFEVVNDGITDDETLFSFTEAFGTYWQIIGAAAEQFNAELKYVWDAVNSKCLVYFCAARGQARNTVIKYGVNLVSMNRKLYVGDLYSGVRAYWTSGGAIAAQCTYEYPTGYTGRKRTLWLDCTDMFQTTPSDADLLAAEKEYVETHDFNALSDLSVEFVPMENTTEYVQPPVVSPLTDTAPYSFRTSGGALSLGLRNRETDSLIGGTVAWNQLAFELSSNNWSNTDSVSYSDGIATAHKDSSTGGSLSLNLATGRKANVYAGHKYLFIATVQTVNGQLNLVPDGSSSHGTLGYATYTSKTTIKYLWNCGTNDVLYFLLRGYTGSGVTSAIDFTVENPMCIDLTLMFGSTIADYVYTLESGTAGAGIAWLKKYGWFTEDYYPYHAATLESVKTSAHVMRDADDNIIGNYALDTVELRGILKKDASNNLYYDGDTYAADGTVTRKYGIVDLGTLTYSKSSMVENTFVAVDGMPSDFPVAPNSRSIPNWVSIYDIYSNVGIEANGVDKAIAWRVAGGQKGVMIRDSAYATLYTNNDVEGFKSAMSGVYLVYERTTPTTETASPYINPQIVDALGTEQYVDAGTRDFDMPVGHETEYTFVPIDNRLYLCDTATVDASLIGVSATAKCVRVVYNVLTDMYDTVTVGTVQQDIVDTILKLGE